MRSPLLLAAALLLTAAPARAEENIVTVRFEPPSDAPILGPRFAPVTVEFFCDLADRHSARIHALLERLRERHPERLRVIYRPVARGRSHARTHDYVEAGREAFGQERFGAFLSAYQDDWLRRPRRAALKSAAERAGLDVEQFERALADDRHADAVRRAHYRRRRYRVRGVPGLLFNGKPYAAREARNLAALEEAYEEAYERGRARLEEGARLSRLYPRLLNREVASQPVPEVGVGTVDGLEQGQQPPEGPPPLLGGAVDATGPHSRGPEDAEVVLIFFCSFQTRNCMSMSQILEEVRAAYREELRVVFKHLFDEEDEGQANARLLHEASLCADEQGAFWDFYDQMYRRQVRRNVTLDYILRQLEGVEPLDLERFERCVEVGRYAETVQDHLVAAHRLGVTLTPSFVIGGRLYVGTKSFDELRALIDQELAPGLLERLAPSDARKK